MSDGREIRLFDGQWMNIINAHDCWDGHSKEEAVVEAIKMVEDAMAKNFKENMWPPTRIIYDDATNVMAERSTFLPT